MSLILLMLFQLITLLLVAPLFDGIARKLRAKFQSRHGCPIWQSYYDIFKLLKRGRTYPNCTGYEFKIAPYLLAGTTMAMFCALPITYYGIEGASQICDILLIIYLGAIFRFVFTIASMDSGSAFGGVSASRENMLGFYVEPVLIISLSIIMLKAGTTSLLEINSLVRSGELSYVSPSFAVASIVFLWAMYFETGRKPYDLAEAEQELQEGVLGEYSGKDLVIIKLALMVKQFVMIGFFIVIFEPWNFQNPLLAMIVFILEAGLFYVLGIFIDNFGPRYSINLGVKFTSLIALMIALGVVVLYALGV